MVACSVFSPWSSPGLPSASIGGLSQPKQPLQNPGYFDNMPSCYQLATKPHRPGLKRSMFSSSFGNDTNFSSPLIQHDGWKDANRMREECLNHWEAARLGSDPIHSSRVSSPGDNRLNGFFIPKLQVEANCKENILELHPIQDCKRPAEGAPAGYDGEISKSFSRRPLLSPLQTRRNSSNPPSTRAASKALSFGASVTISSPLRQQSGL